MAASTPKRSCVQSQLEQGKDDNNFSHWISAVMSLCTNNTLCHIILTPLKITNCNASTHVGSTFSVAFCETEYFEDGLVFGDVFLDGMEMLVNYIKNKSFPENKEKILVLNKLLKFINGGTVFKTWFCRRHDIFFMQSHLFSPVPQTLNFTFITVHLNTLVVEWQYTIKLMKDRK